MTHELIEFSFQNFTETGVQPEYTQDQLDKFRALVLRACPEVLGYQPIADNEQTTLEAVQKIAADKARGRYVVIGPYVSEFGIAQSHLTAYAAQES